MGLSARNYTIYPYRAAFVFRIMPLRDCILLLGCILLHVEDGPRIVP